jgi:hypothetical protein
MTRGLIFSLISGVVLSACATDKVPQFDIAKFDSEIVEGGTTTLKGWLVGDTRVFGLYPLESDLWGGDNPCVNVWAEDEVTKQVAKLYNTRLKVTGTIYHLSYLSKTNPLIGSSAFCRSDTYLVAERIEKDK